MALKLLVPALAEKNTGHGRTAAIFKSILVPEGISIRSGRLKKTRFAQSTNCDVSNIIILTFIESRMLVVSDSTYHAF